MDSDKRKRDSESSMSSIGEVEKSMSSERTIKPKKKKGKKLNDDKSQNQFAALVEDDVSDEDEAENEISYIHDNTTDKNISSELRQIHEKLNKVEISNNETLKGMVTEIVKQVREDMIKIFEGKIDKLESRIFDVEKENDNLKKEIEKVRKEAEHREDVLRQAVTDQDETISQQGGRINGLDQYSRRNNIIISGIQEDKTETPMQTTEKIVTILNEKFINLNLHKSDIDISHRLGKIQTDRPRPIIAKFVSRLVRNEVMFRRRELKGTRIFINEDLSHLNRFMLTAVKKTIPDNEAVWTRDGTLHHKTADGKIHVIPYSEYKRLMGMDQLSFYRKPDNK